MADLKQTNNQTTKQEDRGSTIARTQMSIYRQRNGFTIVELELELQWWPSLEEVKSKRCLVEAVVWRQRSVGSERQ